MSDIFDIKPSRERRDDLERNAKRIARTIVALFIIGGVGLWAGGMYIVVHFISKFW